MSTFNNITTHIYYIYKIQCIFNYCNETMLLIDKTIYMYYI